MFTVADRVKETSTTTGTGSITLAGAATGFRSFSSVLSTSDRTYYTIEDGANWEVGIGTLVNSTTLSRDTVLASSNSGSKVNWSAGTRNVFCVAPARAFNGDPIGANVYQTPGTTTWVKPAGAKFVHVVCVGGGGGGASGGASANTAYGGTGGGSGAAKVVRTFPADRVGDTESVVVGAGGAGGASVVFTAAGSNGGTVGNPGSAGGDSSFGNWLKAEGGNGGTVNTSNAAIGGAGAAIGVIAGYSIPIEVGGAGADGGATDNNPAATAAAPSTFAMPSGGGAGGGVGITTAGIDGTAGESDTAAWEFASGGGGGGNAYSATASATAGAGGNGGSPGGGGGGGGAARTATTAGRVATSGKGGNGGDGIVMVLSYA